MATKADCWCGVGLMRRWRNDWKARVDVVRLGRIPTEFELGALRSGAD